MTKDGFRGKPSPDSSMHRTVTREIDRRLGPVRTAGLDQEASLGSDSEAGSISCASYSICSA
ncbi:hypothetical protein JL101_008250 [Skermanella rosea]|uniref:hypothetical protein n=1 Tax=Skermanella rosea TaxID=1817965 RepID=UPI0019336FEE|nr:hypothetical protein [Skermanella rosea]UEM05414.1 hypothetical protein JL101_008250 [Skermanella rosea]